MAVLFSGEHEGHPVSFSLHLSLWIRVPQEGKLLGFFLFSFNQSTKFDLDFSFSFSVYTSKSRS